MTISEQQFLRSVAEANISSEREDDFRAGYLKGRAEIGAAEKIFRHFDAFQRVKEPNDSAAFGFNVILPKGPFVEHANWVPADGWEFAVAAERHLFAKFVQELDHAARAAGQWDDVPLHLDAKKILARAKQLSAELSHKNYSPGLIILTGDFNIDFSVDLAKQLMTPGSVPDWELPEALRTHWIIGKHQGQWLVAKFQSEPPNMLFVVDVRRFASLRQHDPEVELQIHPLDRVQALEQGIPHPEHRVNLILYQSYDLKVIDQRAVWGAPVADSD